MNKFHSPEFGALLVQLRTERSLSQEALAERADVTRNYIIRLEKGRADPGLGVLLRLSDAFGLAFPEFARKIADIVCSLSSS